MKAIIGLGNPGEKYRENFHNLGFIAADRLAQKLKVRFALKAALKCMLASGKIGGEKFLIVKPLTYMNLSGESARAVLSYYKIDPGDALVIYDDLDINIGELRFRESGSAGTHNGMKSVVSELSTEEFPRLRIGIKKEVDFIDTIDYVLSDIPKDKMPVFIETIERAANCAEDFLNGKPCEYLMQNYNGKAR